MGFNQSFKAYDQRKFCMVSQYPDTVVIVSPASNSTQDENGNWEDAGSETSSSYSCRYEMNTVGNNTGYQIINSEDGQKTDVSGVIYLKTSDTIKLGAELTITKKNGQVIKGKVKGFDPGQLNARIWL